MNDKLIKMRGGNMYAPVDARLQDFRKDHPNWSIITDIHELNLEFQICVSSATIMDDLGRIIAKAYKHETASDFKDYIEKSGTGAVGRALALCGYGSDNYMESMEKVKKSKELEDLYLEITEPGISMNRAKLIFVKLMDKMGQITAEQFKNMTPAEKNGFVEDGVLSVLKESGEEARESYEEEGPTLEEIVTACKTVITKL